MTLLLGPADADHFRVKIGRFGDRFYTDPLPACPIAPRSDWHGPSVSVTKPPFANKWVPMRAIADMTQAEWERLAGLDADARYEAIKAHDKAVSRINMTRGTIVHRFAEDRLLGRQQLFVEPGKASEQAEKFRPALEAFFDAYQPELVACEVVCLHRTLNGVGYGGTADAFVRIDGDVWAVDWKSRNSDHGAYPEEAAQGGAYIGAEYMIVAGDDGQAVRVKVPDVAGVLIVSIREDGYRAYPIDADGAVRHYAAMHAWWTAQQGLTAIGKPWANRATKADDAQLEDDLRRSVLRARYAALDDTAKLAFQEAKPDPDDLDAVEAALNAVDPFASTVIPPVTVEAPTTPVEAPALPSAPDEGPEIDDDTFAVLEGRFNALGELERAWIGGLSVEAKRDLVGFHANKSTGRRTVRRYEITRGLVLLAEHGHDDPELVREIVATVVGEAWPFFLNVAVGHAVGCLDAEQASRFAGLCDRLCADVAAVELRTRNTAA